jgi:hypothetical protein
VTANELLLKMYLNALNNVAIDNETLFGHLNLRVAHKGYPHEFRSARPRAAMLPYPSEADSKRVQAFRRAPAACR